MVHGYPRRRCKARICAAVALCWVSAATAATPSAHAMQTSAPLCAWSDPALEKTELAAARLLWRQNVAVRSGAVRPSRAYSGVWLRDSFWTLTALGNSRVSALALKRFAARQRPTGQVPTQFRTFITQPLYYPDESTSLFLIWSAWQSMHGGRPPKAAVMFRALAYVRAHARAGRYVSAAGSYHSWFDSYRLARADTLSYNQGLFVDALLAAQSLRLGVTSNEVNAAMAGYQSLAARPGGYLPFSASLAWHDISGLVGDFISMWLFNKPLLRDSTVQATLASQRPFFSGYRVVTDARGRYLPVSAFIVRVQPGDYQNGGSWLLFDYLGLAAGFLHHVPGSGAALRQRLLLEFELAPTFHEYLNTNPLARLYKNEPSIRDGFSWDTFVTVANAVVLGGCAR